MATLFIGQNKIFLPEVDSTNSYASILLKNVNAIEGTAVFTHHQTEGKGQRGNSWNAEPAKNITLSVILKPSFLSVNKSFYLSKITALSLYDVLAEVLVHGQFDIKIKWPNDIVVDQKKIAGVLIENAFKESSIASSIIGIGLNVNQHEFGGLNNFATSVFKLTQSNFDLEEVMELVFLHLEKWYLQLRSGRFNEIDKAYLNVLFKLNDTCLFEDKSKQFTAKLIGVSEAGLLLLELETKEVKAFDIKEVKMFL